MYQLMVSGGTGVISTMSLTSGANKWASRAVIVLQLAAWSAVGIVLLQKGVISLQKGQIAKNFSESTDTGNFGLNERRTKEIDLTAIPVTDEFSAKVDRIKNQDAWMKHRNEVEAPEDAKSREKTGRSENFDSAAMKNLDEEWEIFERTRDRAISDSPSPNDETSKDSTAKIGETEEMAEIADLPADETADTLAKKSRKKANIGMSKPVTKELTDDVSPAEEFPAKIGKTAVNKWTVEDPTSPTEIFDESAKQPDFPDELNAKRTAKTSHWKTMNSEDTEVNSTNRKDLVDEIPANAVGQEGRNESSDASSSDFRAQETAWESRKKMRLSHLSGGGAAAAVAMVAVGAVMLILGPAVIVLRALDERRQERRFLKLSGQDDLPPTYEQATLMDEAPRYSTLSLNTILGPPPPPSPSPTFTRVHLV